ncbi:hypothetical protein JCM15519_19240 [Fundidesulfovibrio butyratiphilus]
MKSILVTLVIVSCLSWGEARAEAKVYQCVRPDGTVVCTTTDTSGDPSVTCNFECPDCNMVCVARSVTIREDGRVVEPPMPKVHGRKRAPAQNGKETPESCRAQYERCMAKCRSNPLNKSKYNVDACISSCYDTFTGCGTLQ